MAKLCSSQDCTSCLACYNACPFGAISIDKTELSVLAPQIDPAKCKDCGLCEKSCPILTAPTFQHPLAAIALYCKNEADRKTCSSGGLVTTLSRHFISQGGVVYGASAFGVRPGFRRVTSNEELELLKGSKYVYCDPSKIYTEVKKDLQSGLKCLFIGLPCNIAGLKQYLRQDYENLTTIDLICHGAPPFEYLKAHIESKVGSGLRWGNISFRGKMDFSTSVFDESGRLIYTKSQYEDEYFAAFMQGVFFRPSCYNCRFARAERVSDITAGDFWGLGNDALNGYKGKVSLALLNTQKGTELLDSAKELFFYEAHPIEEAISGNKQLREPTRFSREAEIFRATYESTKSLDKAFMTSGIKKRIIRNRLRRILLALPKRVIKLLRN